MLVFAILAGTLTPRAGLPQLIATGGHFVLFALLGFAAAVRFATSEAGRGAPARTLAMIVLAIWVLAAGTELAQSRVPGRSPELADWVTDMAGAVAGLAVAGPVMRAVLRRRG